MGREEWQCREISRGLEELKPLLTRGLGRPVRAQDVAFYSRWGGEQVTVWLKAHGRIMGSGSCAIASLTSEAEAQLCARYACVQAALDGLRHNGVMPSSQGPASSS